LSKEFFKSLFLIHLLFNTHTSIFLNFTLLSTNVRFFYLMCVHEFNYKCKIFFNLTFIHYFLKFKKYTTLLLVKKLTIMTSIKEVVLHPNHIKKLVSSRTPSGRASKTETRVEVLTKIFLKAKNTNNIDYQKYGLGFFKSVGCERTIRSTLRFLESAGYISRVIKTFKDGKKIKRILYIKLELENIVVALKNNRLDKVFNNGKKLPINRDNNLLLIYNHSRIKNNHSNECYNKNTSNTSNIININNNLPNCNIEYSTPIKNSYNNIIYLLPSIGFEEIAVEAKDTIKKLGLEYKRSTINSILEYIHNKNISFNSKQKLKAYMKKMIDSLIKIQEKFRDDGVRMNCLPVGYDKDYKTFTYTTKEVVANETLLKKINTLAKTDFNIEVLRVILYNSYANFNKAESLINYLVHCFAKEAKIELPKTKRILTLEEEIENGKKALIEAGVDIKTEEHEYSEEHREYVVYMFKKIEISKVVKDDREGRNKNCRIIYDYEKKAVSISKIKDLIKNGYSFKKDIPICEYKRLGDCVSHQELLRQDPSRRSYIISEEEFYQHIKNGVKGRHFHKDLYSIDEFNYKS